MQASQRTKTGPSNPRKVKRVRGSNKCKEVASLEAGKKLKVTFYNNRTVGTNSNLFSRHLGKIIRDKNMCPLGVSSWCDIKQQRFDHMLAAVEDKFESVDFNDHRDHIFGLMNESWNKWRGYLHATYVKNKPIVQALKNIPKAVEKKEWEWLVKEHFCFESFQAGKHGNPPNLAIACFETCKKDNLLVERETIEKHAQIEEILNAEPYMPSIEIVQKCCGPRNRSHVFGFGGGVKAKDMRGGTSSKAELLSELCSTQEKYKSLNEEKKSLNDHLSTIEDDLKEIRKMKELFAAQPSHDLHMTSPVSFE
uniref:TNP2-like transposon protein n=1 Tax=Solanum tuberosum TaxID=4113 RepID=M1AQZ9_SOLTU